MKDEQFRRVDRPEMSEADRAIHRVAEATHRLNMAVQGAVDQGVTIELVRVSRYHDSSGNWGDQLVPTIRQGGNASG